MRYKIILEDNKKENSCVIKEEIIVGKCHIIKEPIADRPFTKEAAAQIDYEKLLNDEMYQFEIELLSPDQLKLPVPEVEYETVVLKPSAYQQEMIFSLAERAEAVRDQRVDVTTDNMLRITNDGRKLALDQRLLNEILPDDENSKTSRCVEKAFEIWEQTKKQKIHTTDFLRFVDSQRKWDF